MQKILTSHQYYHVKLVTQLTFSNFQLSNAHPIQYKYWISNKVYVKKMKLYASMVFDHLN